MKRGFTLIELLVVISIISLLASIVFSSLQSARDEAKESAFISELTQLQRAVELYRLQYGEAPNTNRNAGQIDSINNGSDTTSPLAQLVTNEYISTIGPDLSLAQESGSNGYPQVWYTNNDTQTTLGEGEVGGINDVQTYTFTIFFLDGTRWCVNSSGVYPETDEGSDGNNFCQQR